MMPAGAAHHHGDSDCLVERHGTAPAHVWAFMSRSASEGLDMGTHEAGVVDPVALGGIGNHLRETVAPARVPSGPAGESGECFGVQEDVVAFHAPQRWMRARITHHLEFAKVVSV